MEVLVRFLGRLRDDDAFPACEAFDFDHRRILRFLQRGFRLVGRVADRRVGGRNLVFPHELFGKDLRSGVFELKSVSNEIFRQGSLISSRRTAKFGTRTLDLLHVASAVFLRTDEFCTFDKKQAELAQAEGLAVRGC